MFIKGGELVIIITPFLSKSLEGVPIMQSYEVISHKL